MFRIAAGEFAETDGTPFCQAMVRAMSNASVFDWVTDCGAEAITMGLMAFVSKIVGAAGDAHAEQSLNKLGEIQACAFF